MITAIVEYRLREYLSVALDLAPYLLAARKRKEPWQSIPGSQRVPASLPKRIVIITFATPAFFYKVSRVGQCTFTFTSEGVTRQSKLGAGKTSWDEIVRVYRFSQAYLFAKQKGAMPVPYRCLSYPDRSALESLLASKGFGASDAA
ncbi:MAG: YcxB family protein [Gammaproteobacteria bacterium]